MTRFAVSLILVIGFIQIGAIVEFPESKIATNASKNEQEARTVWRRTANGWENMKDWEQAVPTTQFRTESDYKVGSAIMAIHPMSVTFLVLLVSLGAFAISAQNELLAVSGRSSDNSQLDFAIDAVSR